MITTAPNSAAIADDAQLAQEQTQAAPATATQHAATEIQRMISETAYYIAQRRGFEPGHEVDDWLQAEAQVFDSLAERER